MNSKVYKPSMEIVGPQLAHWAIDSILVARPSQASTGIGGPSSSQKTIITTTNIQTNVRTNVHNTKENKYCLLYGC